MALVDHERVVALLKERVMAGVAVGKSSWGQRELRLLIQDLEVECVREERAAETLFRLFTPELEALFFNHAPGLVGGKRDDHATTDGPAGDAAMQKSSDRRETNEVPKEDSWSQDSRAQNLRSLAAARS